MTERITGIFSQNKRGFGFVIRENGQENDHDIYISGDDSRNAMSGDLVEVDLIPRIHWQGLRPEGIITRIIKRSTVEVTGVFDRKKHYSIVFPINEKEGIPVRINKGNSLNAVSGDWVTAEITKYPEKGRDAEGKIIEIIADKEDPLADIKTLIRSKNIHYEFPPEAKKQAEEIYEKGISEDEIKGRRDFRDKKIFTIDGADSKDFDDAVSIEKTDAGEYILGVHIADVGHYVKSGSALDNEALKRGNSVYVLNQVVPMLPEELSNGLCSLNEGVDRLTLSCIMKVNSSGEVIDHEICESVIRSTHRLVYDDISDLIENEDLVIAEKYADIKDDIFMMNRLYEILADKRDKRGSIDFDVDEAHITLNNKGIPVSVDIENRRTANRLIEEFMLLANETVAEQFYWLNLPFIFRVHEKPEMKKVMELKQFLDRLGIRFKADPANVHPKIISDIITEVSQTRYGDIVGNVMLRAMQKAYYSTDCGGHFGLSLKYYTHFTSPIRRYPDLYIHRVIKEWIHGNNENIVSDKAAASAVYAAENSSRTERTAMELERQAEKMKKAQYMMKFIGNTFEGVISGVSKFGFFVQLPNTIEGLVRLSEMKDDYYTTYEDRYMIHGERTGKTYRLGDSVKVRVIAANRYNGEIDFVIAGKKNKEKKRIRNRKRGRH